MVRLALIGFGNVGRAFARLLLRKREALARDLGVEWRVVAIAARRAGGAIDPQGLDLSRALDEVARGGSLAVLSARPAPVGMDEFIRASGADVLFENTPVNYQTGQPAIDHLVAGLEAGMHGITANKGPVVHAYRRLRQLAEARGRHFLFESAVMDGAPIFSLWRSALPGLRLESFRGILNSTTNLILTLMESGQSFDEAVAQAQATGVAETDPSGDIQGWDAAVKVAALATVLMDSPLLPQDVDRQGIEAITPNLVREAGEQGRRWKLICQAERAGESVRARVAPERVGPEDPLFGVMGTSSSITFDSDVLGRLTITEANPGPETTAYGLLADFLNAVREPVGLGPLAVRPV
ncbi:MAG TPA: homoserine dehydrogenase [Anaerolineales bacterium]|nr:homoserine dehydrogenase [Anaerolineales bacterium]